MSTNSYDRYANSWASKKSSETHFAHQYLEKPAMYAKLPDLKSKSVLVLGCGSSEECLELAKRGATSILAIDSSQGLLELAENLDFSDFQDLQIEFSCQRIEELNLGSRKFDLVFSSLTMHYVEDWQAVLVNLKKHMNPEAKFLFSCHHPIKWGAKATRSKEQNSFILGYKKYKNPQHDFEVYGDYLTPRAIEEKLFGQLEITHFHKPISLILRIIRDSGFILLDLIEPLPLEETKRSKPDFWQTYSKIPLFLIVEVGLE
jgi:SAM-dependent methyltransferase